MNKQKKWIWSACCVSAIGLTILSLSPVVIPAGKYEPMLWGMPYTFWMGFLISCLIVGITYLGTLFHPGRD